MAAHPHRQCDCIRVRQRGRGTGKAAPRCTRREVQWPTSKSPAREESARRSKECTASG